MENGRKAADGSEQRSGKAFEIAWSKWKYKGFAFVMYSIERVILEPELLTYVYKGLYGMVASHFGVSAESAERNIRTVKEVIWEYGDRELLYKIFGDKSKEVPGNAVFIDALAAYLMESCSTDGNDMESLEK